MEFRFWRKTPDPSLARIADALEKLLVLATLALEARGISSPQGEPEEAGEIYYENVDPRDVHAKLVAARELELEQSRRDWARELSRTDFSTAVWAGPEGAEDAALPL